MQPCKNPTVVYAGIVSWVNWGQVLWGTYLKYASFLLQVFDRLSAGELDGKPDAWTHSALCLAFRRGEQHQAVMEVYRMMKAENMLVYKDVFYAVLEACERLGLWREGRDVLQDIQVPFKCSFDTSQLTLLHKLNVLDESKSEAQDCYMLREMQDA